MTARDAPAPPPPSPPPSPCRHVLTCRSRPRPAWPVVGASCWRPARRSQRWHPPAQVMQGRARPWGGRLVSELAGSWGLAGCTAKPQDPKHGVAAPPAAPSAPAPACTARTPPAPPWPGTAPLASAAARWRAESQRRAWRRPAGGEEGSGARRRGVKGGPEAAAGRPGMRACMALVIWQPMHNMVPGYFPCRHTPECHWQQALARRALRGPAAWRGRRQAQ